MTSEESQSFDFPIFQTLSTSPKPSLGSSSPRSQPVEVHGVSPGKIGAAGALIEQRAPLAGRQPGNHPGLLPLATVISRLVR